MMAASTPRRSAAVDGDFGGERGGAADVEERVVAADGAILRHVAAGLAKEQTGVRSVGRRRQARRKRLPPEAAAVSGWRTRGGRGLSRRVRCPMGCNGVSVWGRRSICSIESSGPASGAASTQSDPGAADARFRGFVLKSDSKGLVSQLFERSILRGPGVNLLCARLGTEPQLRECWRWLVAPAAWCMELLCSRRSRTPLFPIGGMGIQL